MCIQQMQKSENPTNKNKLQQTLQLQDRWWKLENKPQQFHRPTSVAEEIQEIQKDMSG